MKGTGLKGSSSKEEGETGRGGLKGSLELRAPRDEVCFASESKKDPEVSSSSSDPNNWEGRASTTLADDEDDDDEERVFEGSVFGCCFTGAGAPNGS